MHSFKKTPLAAAVSLALGAGSIQFAQRAQAQDESPQVVEEIVTYGIRQSLKRSMDLKRNRDGVVDAITSEDIGDFPDSNLAESLQRITGVSIDRERGEGSRVTVRGFGPDFNLVTLNGRQMPTHSGVGRSFDFADLASENIAAVEIYKTGQANVPSGGVGSSINVRTTRPLDAPGLVAAVSATGVIDESTETGQDLTPSVSALFSGTFMEDRLGIALSASFQERDSGFDQATIGGWRPFAADETGWGTIPNDADQVNRPGVTGHTVDVYAVPQSAGYSFHEYEQTRLNGQLTLQYQVSDNIELTFDYTLAELEVGREYHDYSGWFNFGGQESAWTNGPVASATLYAENNPAANNYGDSTAYPAGSDFATGRGVDARRNELSSAGLNLLWDVTDSLRLEFDYHNSTTETGANSPWGTSALIGAASFTRQKTSVHLGAGDIPVLQLDLLRSLHPDDMIVSGSVFTNEFSEMDISQATVRGSYEFDASFVESIDFGLQMTELDHESGVVNVQRDAWGGVTPRGWISHLAQPFAVGDAFDQFSGSSDPRLTRNYYRFDFEALVARTEEHFAANDAAKNTSLPADPGPCGTGLCPSTNWTTQRRTNEETLALYAQAKGEFDIGLPVEWRLGLRFEQTDVTSAALSAGYTGIVWVGGNELTLEREKDAQGNNVSQFFSYDGDYDFLLPNLDFKLHITDDMVGRLSWSKTLTRPNFDQIQGGQTVEQLVRISGGSGNRGNPGLEPFDSTNIDLSFEYYYGEESYVSVGWFTKDVVNFIGTTVVEEPTFNLPHPGQGELATEAIAALQAAGSAVPTPGEIYGWILENKADDPTVDADRGRIEAKPGDPAATFRYTVPANLEEATVDGSEIALQHSFGESGFGFIFNATFVDADVGYDDLNLEEQFFITGLSDSANLVAYYEKHGLGVRLAYNWRDAFLSGQGRGDAGGFSPTHVDEYKQWDLNASYSFLDDSMSVSLDIINLTDETRYVYGRTRLQTLNAQQLGTRYQLRYTYKFNQ